MFNLVVSVIWSLALFVVAFMVGFTALSLIVGFLMSYWWVLLVVILCVFVASVAHGGFKNLFNSLNTKWNR